MKPFTPFTAARSTRLAAVLSTAVLAGQASGCGYILRNDFQPQISGDLTQLSAQTCTNIELHLPTQYKHLKLKRAHLNIGENAIPLGGSPSTSLKGHRSYTICGTEGLFRSSKVYATYFYPATLDEQGNEIAPACEHVEIVKWGLAE